MKKGWMVSVACIIVLAALIGFGVIFHKEDDKPKVVIVVKAFDKDYWGIFEAGAEKAFADFNIDGKVIAPDSEYPPTKQNNILKNVLGQNPDALIVALVEPSTSIPILMEYQKKNIPVLLADTEAEWKDQTAYIGTDHPTLGKMAGALLGSMLQPGDQVALISGTVFGSIMSDRIKGAREALEAAGIEIATEQQGYDEFGNMKSVMENILQTYPDIKGVFATTDILALAALKVIEEKWLKIPVIGTDGTINMVEIIESGRLSATVSQNPYDIGYLSVHQALKAIKGEAVEKRIDSGVDIIIQDNAQEKLDFLRKKVN
ncbi:MAG: sugar ABC transporter substrate-binding protein [Bacillota bacterium]